MSLYLDTPNSRGEAFSFAWDLGRRAEFAGEEGREPALMRFYYFARGAGADHDPSDFALAAAMLFAHLSRQKVVLAGGRHRTSTIPPPRPRN